MQPVLKKNKSVFWWRVRARHYRKCSSVEAPKKERKYDVAKSLRPYNILVIL